MLNKKNNSEHKQLGCKCVYKISKKVDSASGEVVEMHSISIPIIAEHPNLDSIDISKLVRSLSE